MISNIRNFSKTIWAKVILGIIVVPFVFWGMGDVFRGGNQNILAKIDKDKISTQDFIKYANSLNIDLDSINIENNYLIDEILKELIGQTLLSIEIEKLQIKISDTALSEMLKKNEIFLDDNNKFSRVEYEKYLITNGLSAPVFEERLRNNQLKRLLMNYISGGTFSPIFLTNKTYNDQMKTLKIEALNLEKLYKNKNNITKEEIDNYIKKNTDKIKEKYISFNYSILSPAALVSSNEFNELFFKKIDEIENKIINGINYSDLINDYKLKNYTIDSYNKNESKILIDLINQEQLINQITKSENLGKINLFDNVNEYILYKVNKVENRLPNKDLAKFKERVIKNIINENKFELHKSIQKKINTNTFNDIEFRKLADKNKIKIESLEIKGVTDNNFFDLENNREIYKIPENTFGFALGKNNKAYLVFLRESENKKIAVNNKNYNKFFNETTIGLKNNIYSSYDNYLNAKYKVEINEKTLNRLKNYFK